MLFRPPYTPPARCCVKNFLLDNWERCAPLSPSLSPPPDYHSILLTRAIRVGGDYLFSHSQMIYRDSRRYNSGFQLQLKLTKALHHIRRDLGAVGDARRGFPRRLMTRAGHFLATPPSGLRPEFRARGATLYTLCLACLHTGEVSRSACATDRLASPSCFNSRRAGAFPARKKVRETV